MAPRALDLFRRSAGPKLRVNDDFYRPTLCRWIYNEDIQRARRTMRFNEEALASIAAEAVNAQRCVSFENFVEGSSHRMFLLRFDNGSEAFARIPLPVIGNTHLVAASEVATMDFARTVLNIPVPRVHTWSSEPTEVGADFIICEKPPGRDLRQVWSQTTGKTRNPLLHVSRQINSIDQKFLDNPLSSYGSIFYKKDIKSLPHEPLWPDGRQDEASKKFVIGPMTSWNFWRGERPTLEIDRGPWKDLATHITALIRCEQEWLRRYAKPRPVGDQFIRSDEDNSPAAHIELLDKFLSVLDALIPDTEISPPTLWHTNLDKSNIFVSPTPPHDILGVIDWQTTVAWARYLQSDFPKAMVYTGGPFEVHYKPGGPPLPEGFKELSAEKRAVLKKREWEAAAQNYHMELIKKDPRHMVKVAHPHSSLFIEPISLAIRTWDDGIHYLKRSLMLIQLNWDVPNDNGVPCPLKFSPEEMAHTAEVIERWESYTARVEFLTWKLKVGDDGRVDEVEKFELVKKKNDELRDKWDVAEAGGAYPFQDGGPFLGWGMV